VLPNIVWVGMNRGASWQQHALAAKTLVTAMALPSPQNPLLVLGTSGGILTYAVGGGTWKLVARGGNPKETINVLAIDPSDARVVWSAGTSYIERSADGGMTWKAIHNLPGVDLGGIGSAPAAIPSHTLYGFAALDVNRRGNVVVADDSSIIYQSSDRGKTWKVGYEPSSYTPSGFLGSGGIVFDSGNPNLAMMFNSTGAEFESYDQGMSWVNLSNGYGGDGFYNSFAETPVPPLPVDPVAAPSTTARGTRYIAATHHLIGASFLEFYDRNGGLTAFGLPLTEAYKEEGQMVQVFERARLVASAAGVSISPLGEWLNQGQAFPTAATSAGPGRYFARTHQIVSGRFLTYWQAHQGAVVLGQPISPAIQQQTSDGSGRTYLVQWFENGRLEYHPELQGTAFAVSAGLVGREFLLQRNWL
jgi:photosystem II stability/assembly factor-like uncharacterized protein